MMINYQHHQHESAITSQVFLEETQPSTSLFGTSDHHTSARQWVSGVPHDSDVDPRWQRPYSQGSTSPGLNAVQEEILWISDIFPVGGWATPLKNMSSSIGMMIIPKINGKIKNGNQTTNQILKINK